MINICVHLPNRHDGTSYYRGCPIFSLNKQFGNVHTEFADEISFAKAMRYNIAFFQRPSTSQELEAIKIFNRLNIPVIVDYDDLLFDIPTDNPAHRNYMNKQTQETIISIVREASCVWVSTKELKRCLQIPQASLNEKVYVVPNALDDFHLVRGEKASPQKKRNKAVLWRGSPTHERDVMEYTLEISECAEKYSDMPFVFAGYNPWFLTDRMKKEQAIVSGALPVGEYMDFIYSTGAEIAHIPLHDSRFNRCKSNIGWLEMTWGGAACLVPDWEEWRHPGVVTYSNAADYKAGLASLIEMTPEQRAELNKMSWEHIKQNFLLSKVNHIRMSTILACIANDGWPKGFEPLHDPDVVMELK